MTVRYRHYIAFLLIITASMAVFFVVSNGHYPVASVNGALISKRKFEKDYRATAIYYENIIQTYSPEFSEENPKLTSRDLQMTVLNQLVENVLVRTAVQKEFGSDLEKFLDSRLDDFDNDEDFKTAATTLYGLNFNDLRAEVLVPQAEHDLLSSQLLLRGETFEDWLAAAKQSSDVTIFSFRFYWDGDEVKAR